MSLSILDIAFHHLNQEERDRLDSTRDATNSIVVPAHTSALEAASQAENSDSDVIVVVDSSDQIKGVVAVPFVQHQVRTVLGHDSQNLQEAIQALEADFNRAGRAGTDTLRGPANRSFHHEWLNEARPQLYWCEAGRHYVTRLPCNREK
ncbi:MAG TPA: hypothetical protein VI756_09460 [Blastocatellia bacterium]